MKRIIAIFTAFVLVLCFSATSVFASGAQDFFDTDITIQFSSEEFEIGRSVKFMIDFPECEGPDSIEVNEVIYYNIHVRLVSITDTSGILKFSRVIDPSYTSYEGYFTPSKSGETQIVAEYAIEAFFENGEQVTIPGDEWRFTVTGDTITVEEIEVESGYFENSSEETFDTSSYYAQQYEEQLSASGSVESEPVEGDDTEGNNIITIILIIILVPVVLLLVLFLIRTYNINKYKKRK